MKINIITIILIFSFIYPILKGFLFKFSSEDMKKDINSVLSNISFILALFLGIYFSKKVFTEHSFGIYLKLYNAIPRDIVDFINSNPFYIYLIAIPAITFVIYNIIYWALVGLSLILFFPLVDGIESSIKGKSDLFRRITGSVFQLPRAICYLILVTFFINIFSMFNKNQEFNRELEKSQTYNRICQEVVIPLLNSNIAKQLPSIIDNSFKIVIKQNNSEKDANGRVLGPVVYYNGITLEEGIRSNSEIDSFSKAITVNETKSKLMSKVLYNWVGNNIDYDDNKANKVMNDDFTLKSGAIPTFNTRKGICFDYACLYVAMCKANGLKVRIITGEGFNGVNWVSHAWNQVFIPEEDVWINVDPTFYKGGNYFDSARFTIDHRDAKIADEW